MNMRNVFITALILVPLIYGCGNMTEAKPAAESAMSGFHENYNVENFGEIYENAHGDFRKTSDFESFSEFMGAVYSKLGKVVSTENKGWRVKNLNLRTFVVIQQETVFEEGVGMETFHYRIKDSNAVLVGYNINSMDLIVN